MVCCCISALAARLQGYLHNKSVPGFGALGVFGVGQSLARLGNPRENLGGASKRALWASSEALCRSSGACCASYGPFGSVLGSISGPSRPQNLCSRRGESIDFRKSAFPLSIFILGSKSPLKVTSWTPKWRSRRAQSASRALPDALGDAFWPSLGVSWSAPGCPWAVLERSGPSRGYPRACLGPFLEGFGMDLEVRAAKEEGIHSEPS